MKVNLQNIIKKISQEGNSASLLLCHKNIEEQLQVAEELSRKILKLKRGKSYKTCPDVFGIWPENIKGKTIKIEQIHEFIKKTQLKPYSRKFKIGVIISADKMTTEAQNALLKTLEEPPKNTFLILTSVSPTRLLPTIISRCQVIELAQKDRPLINKDKVRKIMSVNLIKRFEMMEEIVKQKNKTKVNEDVNDLIEILLTYFRKQLLKSHKDSKDIQNIFDIIELIETTRLAIDSNVNLRLALENLMINLPLREVDN